ncbi:unnamed protein product [Ophioblennius macclurei]
MILIRKLWISSVFLAVLSDVGAIWVDVGEDEHVLLRGDDVTLPCSFQSDTPKLAVVTWSVVGSQPGDQKKVMLTYYFATNQTDVSPEYEGRVFMVANASREKTYLRLTSVTMEDDKTYECRVQIPGDEEGKQTDTTRLVIGVPVSTPICDIQGTVRPGENINLTCFSEEGTPPPSYRWERGYIAVGHRRRFLDHGTTRNGGLLSMYNISEESSGLYHCISRNIVRMSSCTVNLRVLPDSERKISSIPFLAGVFTGVAARAAVEVAGVAAGTLESVASAAGSVLLGDGNNDGGQAAPKGP